MVPTKRCVGVIAKNNKGNPIPNSMAKKNGRYSRSKKGKLQPAAMNLSFTAPAVGTNYIDLSLAASLVNRRFYRQGINWSVAGFTVTVTGQTTAPGSVTICKVPTTWVSYNAWVKSRAMWDRMNDQVLDGEPGIKGKYADFKVYMNSGMKNATLQTSIANPADGEILLPTDCAFNLPASNGNEWVYSKIQIPDDGGALPPTESELHFLGGDVTGSVGMIRGYAKSRSRPVNTGDPNVPGGAGWMTELFDLADNLDEIRSDISADNDSPPYPVGDSASGAEYYPGGQAHLPGAEVVGYGVFSTGGSNAITAQRSIKGGMFPCGLIEVKSNLSGPINAYDIIVHLVPGAHRGYLCESMEDV